MSKQTFFATLKEAKEQCKSYYEANGQLRNCTCGTCPTKPTMKSDWREPKSAETKSASTVNAETSNYVYVDWKELYKDEIKEMLSLQKSKLIEEVSLMKISINKELEKCSKSNSTSFVEDGGEIMVGKIEALDDVIKLLKE